MSVLRELLALLCFMSGLGFAVAGAGVGLDAWWCRCEAKERRSLTGSDHADVSV